MTTKQTPPITPRVWIEDPGKGCLFARYAWKKYRFMFDDGSTLDVVAMRDDSDLRSAMLAWAQANAAGTKPAKIEGVAQVIPVPAPSGDELFPFPPKTRRVARS